MASNASSPRDADTTPAKPRLTENQKRDNHIKSEKKRREAIRAGFDRLCDIVPDMVGQGRSEAVVLQATVEYMKEQLAKKAWVKAKAMEQGWSGEDVENVYRAAEIEVRKHEEGEEKEKQLKVKTEVKEEVKKEVKKKVKKEVKKKVKKEVKMEEDSE